MAEQRLTDRQHRTTGYIETQSNGVKRLMDSQRRTLGFYEPDKDRTTDSQHRLVGSGDILTSLLE